MINKKVGIKKNLYYSLPLRKRNIEDIDMKAQSYTISELASEFDVTTRTLRHYEDKGLLSPRREGQKRIFTAADRVKLMLILRGRRLGFTIEESLELINLYQTDGENSTQLKRYLQKIHEKQASLAQQLKDIQALQKHLHQAEERCLAAIEQRSE